MSIFFFLFSDHRSPSFEHDFCGRVVTIATTVRAVRAFFQRYNAYKLAVPLGKFFYNFYQQKSKPTEKQKY